MNVDIEFDVNPSPTLGAFFGCDELYRLIVGPVGSGKSSACVTELLLRAAATPPMRPEPDLARGGMKRVRRSRAVVVRNTYPELRDTTIKTFEAWVPPAIREWRALDKCYVVRWHDGVNEVELEVMFRALDQPDDVKKLLSLELTFAYVNEAKEVPRGVFDMLGTRIKRFPAVKDLDEGVRPWFGIWMDTNPPDTDHWLYKLFEEERPAKHALFHQPDGLSPEAENLCFLDPDYYPDLVIGKSKDWVDVMVRSKYGFVKDGKPIYPEFNDVLHVADFPTLPNTDITLGMDFGLTPAAVFVQRDPSDGQLQVFDELTTEDMGAVRFAAEVGRKLKAEYPGRRVEGHGDPAGEQRSQVDERTPFDIVQAAGLPVSPAPTNDFTMRREAVAGLLGRLTVKGRPALVVNPRARTLRKAMQGGYCYRRLQVTGERFADAPEKNRFSHVAEALQYAAVGLGEDRRAVDGGDEHRRVAVRFKVRRAYNGG